MTIQELIADSITLAGGDIINGALDEHQTLSICLNVLDAMNLELANSGKSLVDRKETFTLPAAVQTGAIYLANYALGSLVIRYRTNPGNAWWILDIVGDMDEFNRFTNDWRRGIYIQGSGASANYYLSWTPDAPVTLEVWGKGRGNAVSDLTAQSGLPVDFDLVAKYRIVDFVLNQLMLTDAAKYVPFVQMQKQSIREEQRRVNHLWRVFLTAPTDAMASNRVEEYNWRDDRSYGLLDGDFWG